MSYGSYYGTGSTYVGRVPRMVDLTRLKLCLAAGFSHAQVAKAFGIARSTAADYVRLYKSGDLEEIRRRNRIAQDVMERRVQVGRMAEEQ